MVWLWISSEYYYYSKTKIKTHVKHTFNCHTSFFILARIKPKNQFLVKQNWCKSRMMGRFSNNLLQYNFLSDSFGMSSINNQSILVCYLREKRAFDEIYKKLHSFFRSHVRHWILQLFNPLSRVEIFEYTMNPQSCGR